jgi:hypothetical protein
MPVFRLGPVEERYVQTCGNGIATLNVARTKISLFNIRSPYARNPIQSKFLASNGCN